jgi:hypothetical protein
MNVIKFESQKSKRKKKEDAEPEEKREFVLPRARSRSRDRQPAPSHGTHGRSAEDLEKLHKAGFVMTGARSARITMIREHQAKAAEAQSLADRLEKRAQREDDIIDHFRSLLKNSSTLPPP